MTTPCRTSATGPARRRSAVHSRSSSFWRVPGNSRFNPIDIALAARGTGTAVMLAREGRPPKEAIPGREGNGLRAARSAAAAVVSMRIRKPDFLLGRAIASSSCRHFSLRSKKPFDAGAARGPHQSLPVKGQEGKIESCRHPSRGRLHPKSAIQSRFPVAAGVSCARYSRSLAKRRRCDFLEVWQRTAFPIRLGSNRYGRSAAGRPCRQGRGFATRLCIASLPRQRMS